MVRCVIAERLGLGIIKVLSRQLCECKAGEIGVRVTPTSMFTQFPRVLVCPHGRVGARLERASYRLETFDANPRDEGN